GVVAAGRRCGGSDDRHRRDRQCECGAETPQDVLHDAPSSQGWISSPSGVRYEGGRGPVFYFASRRRTGTSVGRSPCAVCRLSTASAACSAIATRTSSSSSDGRRPLRGSPSEKMPSSTLSEP